MSASARSWLRKQVWMVAGETFPGGDGPLAPRVEMIVRGVEDPIDDFAMLDDEQELGLPADGMMFVDLPDHGQHEREVEHSSPKVRKRFPPWSVDDPPWDLRTGRWGRGRFRLA